MPIGFFKASIHRHPTAAQQVIGREGETATLLSRCPFNSELRGGGFAPRQLRRWALVYVGRCEDESH